MLGVDFRIGLVWFSWFWRFGGSPGCCEFVLGWYNIRFCGASRGLGVFWLVWVCLGLVVEWVSRWFPDWRWCCLVAFGGFGVLGVFVLCGVGIISVSVVLLGVSRWFLIGLVVVRFGGAGS